MIAIVSVTVNVFFLISPFTQVPTELNGIGLTNTQVCAVHVGTASIRVAAFPSAHTHTLQAWYLGNADKVLNNYRGKIEDCVTVHTYIHYTVLEIMVSIQTFSDHFGILYDRKRFGSDIRLCTT